MHIAYVLCLIRLRTEIEMLNGSRARALTHCNAQIPAQINWMLQNMVG